MPTTICLGTPPGAVKDLDQLMGATKTYEWMIHSAAEPDERVLFYFLKPRGSILAKGTVADYPRVMARGNWRGRLFAPIKDVEMIPREVTLTEVRSAFPRWGYWIAPRKSSRVPTQYERKLWNLVNRGTPPDQRVDIDYVIGGVREGDRRWRVHVRERNPQLRKAKLEDYLKRHGGLSCEACGINFKKRYPDLGVDCYEVHHNKPLGSRRKPSLTHLEDLSVLCPNCHRLIHKTDPLLSVRQFSRYVRS